MEIFTKVSESITNGLVLYPNKKMVSEAVSLGCQHDASFVDSLVKYEDQDGSTPGQLQDGDLPQV
jgi:hypothetical protein